MKPTSRIKKSISASVAAIEIFVLVFSSIYSVAFHSAPVAHAAFNPQINYQGKLLDTAGDAVADGDYAMVFKLYTVSSGGTAVWTETRTGVNEVTVTDGLFSVLLGDITAFTGINFNQSLYLGVTIESDSEMTPRKLLGAVPAAFEADRVDGLEAAQFLRSDAENATSTSSTFLTVTQNGTGNILDLKDGSNVVFTVIDGGNVGIGTSSPYAKLSVVGEIVGAYFTGTTTATSTLAGGLDISGGCLAINGTCVPGSAEFIDGGNFLHPNEEDDSLLLGSTDFSGFNALLGLRATSTTGTLLYASSTASYTGTFLDFVDSTGSSLFSVDSSGNLSVNGTASVSGLATLTSGFVSGASSTVNADLTIAGNATATAATTTNLFSETASSTNLFTQNFSLGSLTGFLKATAGLVATSLIDLAADVTGTLPIASGGTGQTSFTNDTVLTVNGSGAITSSSTIASAFLDPSVILSTEIDTYSELNTLVADVTLTHNGLIDTFSELDAIVADKSLANLDDAQTFSSLQTFTSGFLSNASSTVASGGFTVGGISTTTEHLVVQGVGTSTFANGIDLADGCFAIDGTCLSSGGASTFLALTDTPSSFTANRVPFTNSGATALTDSASLVFDGTNLGIGTSTPYSPLSVWSASAGTGARVFELTDSASTTLFSVTDSGEGTLSSSLTATHFVGSSASATSTLAGGLAIETSGFVYDFSSNTVGIGTAAPLGTLDLRQAIANQDVIYAERHASHASPANFINFRAAGGGSGLFVVNRFGGITTSAEYSLSGNSSNLWALTGFTNNQFTLQNNNITSGNFLVLSNNSSSFAGTGILANFQDGSGTFSGLFADFQKNDVTQLSVGDDGTLYTAGRVGIGTTSPASNLTVWSSGEGGSGRLFEIVDNASTTVFHVTEQGTTTLAGEITVSGTGTSTVSGGLDVLALNITGSATSTAANGIDLADGCFAIDGTCLSSGGASTFLALTDTPSSFTANRIPFTNSGATVLTDAANFTFDGTILTVPSGLSFANAATTTIASSALYAFTIATSTTAKPILTIDTTGTGDEGQATTTLSGGFVVNSGAIRYDYSANQTSIEKLDLGPIRFEDDAGVISWVDLPVTSSAAAGTPESYSAQIDSHSLLTVYAQSDGAGSITDARIVVGTSTDTILGSSNIPFGSLIIADGILCVDNFEGANCDDLTRTRGQIYAESSSVTAIDVAENYPTKDMTLSAGELVMFDPLNPVYVMRYDTASIATSSASLSYLGVVSTAPGLLLGGFADNEFIGERKVPITLSGRVPVRVNGEGGEINVGDRLSFSLEAGVATKATTSAMTVGVALEPFAGGAGATSTITVFIDSDYHFARDQFFIDSNGNMAIGTSTTSHKLSVGGDISATGFINVSSKETKKDIETISEQDRKTLLSVLRDIDIATYHYKEEDGSSPLRLGLIAEEAPLEVLSAQGDGVDLYKLSTLTLAGTQELAKQVEDLDLRLTAIEKKVGTSTASTTSTTNEKSFTSFLASIGIAFKDAVTKIGNLAVANLTVGSREKPTGITIYDEVTGQPHCITVRNGELTTWTGECKKIAVETTPPPEPEVSKPDPVPSDTASSTPSVPTETASSTPSIPASDTATSTPSTTVGTSTPSANPPSQTGTSTPSTSEPTEETIVTEAPDPEPTVETAQKDTATAATGTTTPNGV